MANCKTTDTEKWCSKCKKWLPHQHFSKDRSAGCGFQCYCRDCKPQTKRTSKQSREHNLRNTYGISVDDYDRMSEAQDHRCAICGSRYSGTTRSSRLFVDHNHATGQIRGLLCHKCNVSLGHFNDDVTTLAKAIAYLEKYDGK